MRKKRDLGNVEKLVEESKNSKRSRLEPGEVEILKALYKEGVSMSYIAAKLGISKQAVCYQLGKAGIKVRTKTEYAEKYNTYMFKKAVRE